MREEVLIFAGIASLAGTIFLVAVIELIFTVRRRKVREQIEAKIREIKHQANESVNSTVLETEKQIEDVEEQKKALGEKTETEKEKIAEEYKAAMEKLEKEKEHELELAKARAHKYEQEAKLKAEEYLESRKDEVEKELMSLVMSVTKKVLSSDIDYNLQKEIVVKALQEAKIERAVK